MYQEDSEFEGNLLKQKLNKIGDNTGLTQMAPIGYAIGAPIQPPDTSLTNRALSENSFPEIKKVVPEEKSKNIINFMDFSNYELAWKTAEMISKAKCIPKEFQDNPADILVAIQFGYDLGMKPMASLQNIMIVNNRPSIYGDMVIALCMAHPDYIDCIETYDEETETAYCTMKRRGRVDLTRKFSRGMAETAGLWGKRGATGGASSWITHPEIMLQNRARGFCAKRMWADVLKGVSTFEEMQDVYYYESIDKKVSITNTAESMKERLKSKTTLTPQFENILKDVS